MLSVEDYMLQYFKVNRFSHVYWYL